MPVRTTLDHVTIVTDDFEASRPVYDAVFTALGLTASVDYEDPEADEDDTDTVAAIGYATVAGELLILLVSGAQPTRGAHWALAVDDRAAVEAAFRAGERAGARAIQPPREWEAAHLNYYGAQLADQAGNMLEVVYKK
jgi:catechol 2,3-dioxygenase-like lactoylglutathione lyase family enzyme